MDYAGFWIRFVAYIIDAIVLTLIKSVIGMVVGFGLTAMVNPDPNLVSLNSGAYAMYNIVSLAIGVAYFAGLESSSWQATLGKKALGLIVVDETGSRISIARAIGRYFAKILSAIILLIGFIMVAFTERKQGLHDLICKTLIIRGEPGVVPGQANVFD